MKTSRALADALVAGRDVPPSGYFIYRYWNASGELLYVGKTAQLRARNRAHALARTWYPDAVRWEWVEYETELDMTEAEIEAILLEHPEHNQQVALGAAVAPMVAERRSRQAESRQTRLQRRAAAAVQQASGTDPLREAERLLEREWEAIYDGSAVLEVCEEMNEITFEFIRRDPTNDLDESVEEATLLGLTYLAARHLRSASDAPDGAILPTEDDVEAFLVPMAALFRDLRPSSVIDSPQPSKNSTYRYHGSPLTPERYADLASERFAGETADVDTITETVIRIHERGGGRQTWVSTCASHGRRLLQRANAASYVDGARRTMRFADAPQAFTS